MRAKRRVTTVTGPSDQSCIEFAKNSHYINHVDRKLAIAEAEKHPPIPASWQLAAPPLSAEALDLPDENWNKTSGHFLRLVAFSVVGILLLVVGLIWADERLGLDDGGEASATDSCHQLAMDPNDCSPLSGDLPAGSNLMLVRRK